MLALLKGEVYEIKFDLGFALVLDNFENDDYGRDALMERDIVLVLDFRPNRTWIGDTNIKAYSLVTNKVVHYHLPISKDETRWEDEISILS